MKNNKKEYLLLISIIVMLVAISILMPKVKRGQIISTIEKKGFEIIEEKGFDARGVYMKKKIDMSGNERIAVWYSQNTSKEKVIVEYINQKDREKLIRIRIREDGNFVFERENENGYPINCMYILDDLEAEEVDNLESCKGEEKELAKQYYVKYKKIMKKAGINSKDFSTILDGIQ